MRDFETGATRSGDADKIQYRRHFSALALKRFGQYMHKHRLQEDGNLREPDNWKKGIPVDSYADSLYRHTQDLMFLIENLSMIKDKVPDLLDYKVGEMEELLCAILFNAFGFLHVIMEDHFSWALDDLVQMREEMNKPEAPPEPPAKKSKKKKRGRK